MVGARLLTIEEKRYKCGIRTVEKFYADGLE